MSNIQAYNLLEHTTQSLLLIQISSTEQTKEMTVYDLCRIKKYQSSASSTHALRAPY